MKTHISAHDLDAADFRLLSALQQDASRKAEQLADVVGLSPSAVRRRLARLRARGAILGQVALIDPVLAGIEIIVAITVRDESKAVYDRLKRRLQQAREVSQCYTVTGEVDLILHVHMPDMAHFEQWIDRNILSEEAVRRCTSHVVYSRVKFSTAVPLPELPQ